MTNNVLFAFHCKNSGGVNFSLYPCSLFHLTTIKIDATIQTHNNAAVFQLHRSTEN